MPQIEFKEKFAWYPMRTTSGKWIWWKKYIKLMKIYWGPSGEGPVIYKEFYTENEWTLQLIKNDYSRKRPAPPAFFKSNVVKSKGP
jgi:hypothetical protein